MPNEWEIIKRYRQSVRYSQQQIELCKKGQENPNVSLKAVNRNLLRAYEFDKENIKPETQKKKEVPKNQKRLL